MKKVRTSTPKTLWKRLAILAIVLVIGIVASCLALRKPQERNVFVGRIDPVSGYRCRFTLSPEWREDKSQKGNASLSVDYFFPPPGNPIHAWIATYLLHQAASDPTITLLSPRNSIVQVFQMQAGYPAMIRPPLHFTQHHLRINGFPATIINASYKSDTATLLLVYIPDHSVSYRMIGTGTPYNAAETNREMQAIIASFHVEKVVVGTSDKR
jgi:hypothetical protein